jgi:hypothetical protein
MRQGGATASQAASHTGEDEPAVAARLRALAEQGLVREAEPGSRFTARLAPRRRRALPEEIWSALSQEPEHGDPRRAARHRPPRWPGVRGALLGRRGRFMLGAAPVFACFAVTEWMVVTGSGSFTGLIGFIGVIVGSLLAGIFPVMLLVASRRKGEHMPRPVHRLMGHPVLLGGLYLLFLGNVLLHGLVIWKEPWLRAGAVLVAAGIVAMTARMIRNGTFNRRLNIEVREDQAKGRTSFAVTAGGQESASHITLKYRDGERHLQASSGEIPAFSSLRHAIFEPGFPHEPRQIPHHLKVRVHKVTHDGDSEPIGGSITVQTRGETSRHDIMLAKGQVTLPFTDATCRVDIEPTELNPKAQDQKALQRRCQVVHDNSQWRCRTIFRCFTDGRQVCLGGRISRVARPRSCHHRSRSARLARQVPGSVPTASAGPSPTLSSATTAVIGDLPPEIRPARARLRLVTRSCSQVPARLALTDVAACVAETP